MKLTIHKEALQDGLQKVQPIVGTRTTLPILSNVLLKADENNKLWLTTTDLEISVQTSVAANVSKPGSTTLPAKRLMSIIRELTPQDVEITVTDKHLATVKCGPSVFKLIGISEDDFPPLTMPKTAHSFALDQGLLKRMLMKTNYAASSDETRYMLNGVLMSFKEGKMIIVATDGRRLALAEEELEFPKDSELDMIIPSKTVTELLKTLDDEGPVSIKATDKQVVFEFGEIIIVSKLIDSAYPNYKQVIPAQNEERITIEREGLLAAVRRAALMISDHSSSIKLIFRKNKLEILTETPDVGEAKESLPIKYDNKEITIAFNPAFLLDPLKNLDSDEIHLELTDDLSPGVIKTDVPFLYVIMPMRVT